MMIIDNLLQCIDCIIFFGGEFIVDCKKLYNILDVLCECYIDQGI